jgi:hypothetical protein
MITIHVCQKYYISSITRLYGLLRAHQAIIRLADGVAQTGAYGWRTAGVRLADAQRAECLGLEL